MAKTKLDETIVSALDALAGILASAAGQAGAAIRPGLDINEAIGTIIGLEDDLETALALYKTALALHRRNRE